MTLWDATSARHYHWEVEFVKLTNRLKGIISNARYVHTRLNSGQKFCPG